MLQEITRLYKEGSYNVIIAREDGILNSLDPKQVYILIKSLIHLFGQDDSRVKEYLFIALCLEPSLSFRGSFSIQLSIKKDIKTILSFVSRYDGFMEHIVPTGSIDHVNERYIRHLGTLSEKQKNIDIFLIFIFYSLELYDIEHSEYPMIKWLLHHFFKHD